MTRILFVCLGNICRSPLAEGIARSLIEHAGTAIAVDSAGTGDWHIGSPPDRRAIAVAAAHGIDISELRGRQLSTADFERFDHIVALDRSNLRDIRAIQPGKGKAKVSLLLDHAAGRAGQDVADPYTGDAGAFATAWQDIHAGVSGLLAVVRTADSAR